MSEKLDTQSSEPKINFLNSLINYNNKVESLLYLQNASEGQILYALQGLINMLDQKSYKDLEDIYKEIERYIENTYLIKDRKQLSDIHQKILHYLHETWLKDVRFAKPTHGKGSIGIPKP